MPDLPEPSPQSVAHEMRAALRGEGESYETGNRLELLDGKLVATTSYDRHGCCFYSLTDFARETLKAHHLLPWRTT